MKAVRVTKEGSATEIRVKDIPKPTIESGELLVKIRASSIQPADILNSKGGFPKTVSIPSYSLSLNADLRSPE